MPWPHTCCVNIVVGHETYFIAEGDGKLIVADGHSLEGGIYNVRAAVPLDDVGLAGLNLRDGCQEVQSGESSYVLTSAPSSTLPSMLRLKGRQMDCH